MKKEEILQNEKLRNHSFEIIKNILDYSELEMSYSLKDDLELNDSDIIDLLMLLEDKFDILYDVDDMKNIIKSLITIKDLVEFYMEEEYKHYEYSLMEQNPPMMTYDKPAEF